MAQKQVLTLILVYVAHIAGIAGKLRLTNGNEGRLEILRSRGWFAVCDLDWDMRKADIACKTMGFAAAELLQTGIGIMKYGRIRTWIAFSTCTGRENSFNNCKHFSGYRARIHCNENTQVRLICLENDEPSTPLPTSKPIAWNIKRDIRINKLDKNTLLVEINGTWKAVCGDGWDMVDAIVACRDLNLGHPKLSLTREETSVEGMISMSHVTCEGHESLLSECAYKMGKCRKQVQLKCSELAPDLITNIKELQKSIKLVTRKSGNLECSKEERCLSASAYSNNSFYHRSRKLLAFAVNVHNQGTADLRPPEKAKQWQWHACHQHYHSISEFAAYELLTEDGREVASGHKVSFCLEDSKCERGVQRQYRCDSTGPDKQIQGISVGCSDNYGRTLDCQWIDVTDVTPGTYTLRVLLNPIKLFAENNYKNNDSRCKVKITTKHAIVIGKCYFVDH